MTEREVPNVPEVVAPPTDGDAPDVDGVSPNGAATRPTASAYFLEHLREQAKDEDVTGPARRRPGTELDLTAIVTNPDNPDIGRIALAPIVRGERSPTTPGLVYRDDGAGLLYPAALHDWHGEPGHAKTWLAVWATAQVLHDGGAVVIIDYEGTAHTFVDRLRALGVDDTTIADEARVAYHNLPGKTTPHQVAALVDELLTMHANLVVLDAMLPALARNGWADNDAADLAAFYDTIARPLTTTGAAVVTIDHLTKDASSRTRGARGSGAKLQLVDVSYLVALTEPFSRTRPGSFRIRCDKDRFGLYTIGEAVAFANLTPDDGGRHVTITLEAPRAHHAQRDPVIRPVETMATIAAALEANPAGLSVRAIRGAITGRDDTKTLALETLVADGYVAVEPGPRGARIHTLVKPYEEQPS